MQLLNSLFFGSEGSYKFFGNNINFQKDLPNNWTPPIDHNNGLVTRLQDYCLKSQIFRLLTHPHLHVLVHEIGHALAVKFFTNYPSNIYVFTDSVTGRTLYPFAYSWISSKWKLSTIDAAGTMFSLAFCSCKLVAAAALRNYIGWPTSLVLGTCTFAVMVGELNYAYTSISNQNLGDFGNIAKRSKVHLAVFSTIIVAQCIFGLYAAIRCFYTKDKEKEKTEIQYVGLDKQFIRKEESSLKRKLFQIDW